MKWIELEESNYKKQMKDLQKSFPNNLMRKIIDNKL